MIKGGIPLSEKNAAFDSTDPIRTADDPISKGSPADSLIQISASPYTEHGSEEDTSGVGTGAGAEAGAGTGAGGNSERKATGKGRFKSFITNPGTIAAAVAVAEIIGSASALKIYDSAFKRYDRPDYSTTPGLVSYSDVAQVLSREELPFYSDGTRLMGYYYPAENSNGLVIFVHGLHAGADDYLSIYRYLVSRNYSVFSFDCKGTYSSEGDSTVGLCEALVDLDGALKYISTQPRLSSQKLFLLGHSCGGYAVTAALKEHKNIAACAAIAPLNDACGMILQKGAFFGGEAAVNNLPARFLDGHQRSLFGKYADMTAVDGINSTDIPVLIAHGRTDLVVGYSEPTSVISHKDRIRKNGVTYYIGDGSCGGHSSILFSPAANRYRKAVDAVIKTLRRDDEAPSSALTEYCASVNDLLYSEINTVLFERITDMFDSAV